MSSDSVGAPRFTSPDTQGATQSVPHANTEGIDTLVTRLRGNIAAITPDDFRDHSKLIRAKVLDKDLPYQENVNICHYLNLDEFETFFKNNKDYRDQLRQGLCPIVDKGDGRVVLEVQENGLKGAQLCKLLASTPEEDKARITELDLSKVRNLTTMQGKEHSALEGFTSLNKLTLPKDPFYTNPAGLSAVGPHLKHLDMSGSGIASLAFLKDFPHLITLTADGCGKLKDLQNGRKEGIANCTKLTVFSLRGRSQVTNLKPLTSLEHCQLIR